MTKEYNLIGTTIKKEVLDSGLTIYFIPQNNRSTYHFDYYVKYGSLINNFKLENEKSFKKVPFGIAHFLEHKLFEQADGVDPFEYFAKYGIDCNACTSYNYTNYYIDGTENAKEGLDFLIKYVNSPYFTDQNVEKEKGIIIEELNMYKDDPIDKISRLSLEGVFQNSEARIDIGGTTTSVKKITKEDLYRCYKAFYRPDNMVLIISGNYDYDEVMKVIKDNKDLINDKSIFKSIVKRENEPYDINTKFKETKVNGLMIPKMIYTIKESMQGFSKEDKFRYLFMVQFLLEMIYRKGSDFHRDLIKDNKISDLYASAYELDDFLLIEIDVESKNPKEIIPLIKKYYDDIKITNEDLERYKKTMIAKEVRKLDSVGGSAYFIKQGLNDYGDVIFNKLDLIRDISLDKVKKIKKDIDFDNVSIVIGNTKSN